MEAGGPDVLAPINQFSKEWEPFKLFCKLDQHYLQVNSEDI